MPAPFSDPVQVQLRKSQLLRADAGAGDAALLKKDTLWKSALGPLRRNTLPVTLPRVRVALQV
jgi:hypothetical protein